MKRAALAATATVMVALLAGCSAPAVDEPIESAAPLVAESPTVDAGEQTFLDYVRANLPTDTVVPNASDAQLIEAGNKACQAMAEGASTRNLSVIDGEQPNGAGSFDDSAIIVTGAAQHLCD